MVLPSIWDQELLYLIFISRTPRVPLFSIPSIFLGVCVLFVKKKKQKKNLLPNLREPESLINEAQNT